MVVLEGDVGPFLKFGGQTVVTSTGRLRLCL